MDEERTPNHLEAQKEGREESMESSSKKNFIDTKRAGCGNIAAAASTTNMSEEDLRESQKDMEEQKKLDAIVRDLTKKVADLSGQINREVRQHVIQRGGTNSSSDWANMPVEFSAFANLRSPERFSRRVRPSSPDLDQEVDSDDDSANRLNQLIGAHRNSPIRQRRQDRRQGVDVVGGDRDEAMLVELREIRNAVGGIRQPSQSFLANQQEIYEDIQRRNTLINALRNPNQEQEEQEGSRQVAQFQLQG